MNSMKTTMRTILLELERGSRSDYCREVCEADGYHVDLPRAGFGATPSTPAEESQLRHDACLEELLSALVDGELSAEAQREVEQRLERNAELRDCLAGLRQTSDRLQELPTYHLGRQFTERVVLLVELASEGVSLPDPAIEFSFSDQLTDDHQEFGTAPRREGPAESLLVIGG